MNNDDGIAPMDIDYFVSPPIPMDIDYTEGNTSIVPMDIVPTTARSSDSAWSSVVSQPLNDKRETENPLLKEYIMIQGESGTKYYITDKPLGSGGYGAVYKGLDDRGKDVAVKFYELKVTLQMIMHEYTIHHYLNKNNVEGICLFRDPPIITENGSYVVMDFVPGKTLHHVISAARKHDLKVDFKVGIEMTRTFVGMMIQLTEILDRIHKLCVTHYDLKPINIMVSEVGSEFRVTILDLGLGCVQKKCNVNGMEKVQCVPHPSTYGYEAPEVYDASVASKDLPEDYDFRKFDIYALGKIFTDMVTGVCAYSRDKDTVEYLLQKSSEEVENMYNTNNHKLNDLLRAMFAQDWKRRVNTDEILAILSSVQIKKPFPIFNVRE